MNRILILASLLGIAIAANAHASDPNALDELLNPTPIVAPTDLLGTDTVANIAATHPELMQRDAIVIVASDKGDPMAPSFAKDEFMKREAFARMNAAVHQGDHDEARRMAVFLMKAYPDTLESDHSRNFTGKNPVIMCPEPPAPMSPSNEPYIPRWVSQNTKSILYQQDGNSTVLVGTQVCKVGQRLDAYPNVTVEEIRRSEVVFRVQNEHMSKTFVVTVPTGK